MRAPATLAPLARRIVAASLVLAGLSSTAVASAPGVVFVHSDGRGPVRLQVSQGSGADCDSSMNQMLFDGRIAPDQTIAVPFTATTNCACVRSTSVSFPDSNWDSSHQVCGRRRERTPKIRYELQPP